MRTICSGDSEAASQALTSMPELAIAHLTVGATRATSEEFFLQGCGVYMYTGHTSVHVAAAAYDTDLARALMTPAQTYEQGTVEAPNRSTRRSTECPDR